MNNDSVSRFILYKRWIRADNTIRPGAFSPLPDTKLSVTKHDGLSEIKLWQIAKKVATLMAKDLHGRAEIRKINIIENALEIENAPVEDNPNHAHIVGWPSEGPELAMLLLKISRCSIYEATPISIEEH